jgi:hypothetical protein
LGLKSVNHRILQRCQTVMKTTVDSFLPNYREIQLHH